MAKQKVPDFARKALKGDSDAPDLAELAAHFFNIVGGVRAMAKMLHDELHAAKTGSMTRAKILDMIIRVTANTQDKTKKDDLALLTEEDLEKRIEQMMDKREAFNSAELPAIP